MLVKMVWPQLTNKKGEAFEFHTKLEILPRVGELLDIDLPCGEDENIKQKGFVHGITWSFPGDPVVTITVHKVYGVAFNIVDTKASHE